MALPSTIPDYQTLLAGWRELAASGAVALQSLPTDDDDPLLRATLGRPEAPTVVISAGVHGDEPAGPSALLALAREGLPAQFSFVLFPCTNPSGYRAGTRHNARGVDVNRSYGDGVTAESSAVAAAWTPASPVLALDLHEDYEALGFYGFERTNGTSLIARIVEEVEEAGIPVQESFTGIDLGMPVEEAESRGLWRVGRGWIRALRYEPRSPLGGRPFTVWAAEQGVPIGFTFESPGRAPWEVRVRSLAVAVQTVLGLIAAP